MKTLRIVALNAAVTLALLVGFSVVSGTPITAPFSQPSLSPSAAPSTCAGRSCEEFSQNFNAAAIDGLLGLPIGSVTVYKSGGTVWIETDAELSTGQLVVLDNFMSINRRPRGR